MFDTEATGNLANLKNGRDKHGVGVRETEEGGLGIRSLLDVRNSSDHSGVLYRSVDETQLTFRVRMFQRTKGMFFSALSI